VAPLIVIGCVSTHASKIFPPLKSVKLVYVISLHALNVHPVIAAPSN